MTQPSVLYEVKDGVGTITLSRPRVLNALDDHYAAGGYAYRDAYTTYSEYIPAATRSLIAELRVDF